MSSKKGAMKKKLENMHLGKRINYGYKMVITMMLISGLLSIAVIGVLFFNMLNYVNKVNASDQSVKICRINDNAALEEMLKNLDSIEIPQEKEEQPEEETTAEESRIEEAPIGEAVPELDLDSILQNDMTVDSVLKQENTENSKGAEKRMDAKIASDETAVITAGMVITGDVSSEGSMDLVGTINGNIDILGKLNITGYINGNSKAAEIFAEGAKINGEIVSEGSVKIGASSVVIGNITAISAAIAGAVKGDIDVQGPVVLDSSAIVMGNIKSKSVQINNGAVIEGMCSQCYADVSPTSFFDDYKPEKKKVK